MPTQRPIFRYDVLAFLFLITMLYEVRYTHDILRDEHRETAFFVPQPVSNKIILLSPGAAKAGIHVGDLLLAVNGMPYTGTAVLGDAMAHATPGVPIVVRILSSDPTHPGERTISLPVNRNVIKPWEIASDLMLHFLLPAVSLVLGFWVVFVRPRDHLAWLLMGVMVTFPHLLETYKVWGWEPGWREAGMLYHAGMAGAFPIVLFLFGWYFPERFPRGSRYDLIWRIGLWVAAIPFAASAVEGVWLSIRELTDYRSVAGVNSFFAPLDRMSEVQGYVLIGSFFAAMGIKLGMSQSPDARRRLRFVYWGATVAFVPIFALIIWSRIVGKTTAEVFPQWLIISLLSLLVIFPLTLAYVIVVQKAMAVGVAVRQGLQYALARSGVRIVQVLVVAAIIIAAISMADNASRNRPQKITVIGLGIVAIFTIRRVGQS